MGLQSGTGPGVAVVREAAELGDAMTRDDARIVVGFFTGAAALAHALTRRAREEHPLTTTVDTDASSQAQAANRFRADVYVGFEIADDAGCTIYFYEVPTFVSAGGRNLALRIAAALKDRAPELSVRVQGLRHPVLRETRMPAVLCSMAPTELVSLKTSSISAAINDALDAWRENPGIEI
jgi:N-acetylmuramoyl-L-alanine amidase